MRGVFLIILMLFGFFAFDFFYSERGQDDARKRYARGEAEDEAVEKVLKVGLVAAHKEDVADKHGDSERDEGKARFNFFHFYLL